MSIGQPPRRWRGVLPFVLVSALLLGCSRIGSLPPPEQAQPRPTEAAALAPVPAVNPPLAPTAATTPDATAAQASATPTVATQPAADRGAALPAPRTTGLPRLEPS